MGYHESFHYVRNCNKTGVSFIFVSLDCISTSVQYIFNCSLPVIKYHVRDSTKINVFCALGDGISRSWDFEVKKTVYMCSRNFQILVRTVICMIKIYKSHTYSCIPTVLLSVILSQLLSIE